MQGNVRQKWDLECNHGSVPHCSRLDGVRESRHRRGNWRNLTLVNSFTKLFAAVFPTPPQQFSLCAAFTDGQGERTIDGVITRLETDKEIYTFQKTIHFPSRTTEVRVVYNISKCSFPAPGRYQISMAIDGEWVTSRTLHVIREAT